jgi:hypothetical protein
VTHALFLKQFLRGRLIYNRIIYEKEKVKRRQKLMTKLILTVEEE